MPAALGNRRHILRAGIVCDRCNHYFGSKLEHAVLRSQYFNSLRARQALPSRKGKPIFGTGLLNADETYIPAMHSLQARTILFDATPLPNGELPWNKLVSAAKVELYFPLAGGEPDKRLFSRFMAKMAFEALAARICHVDGFEAFLFDQQFDPVRTWARYGTGGVNWPIHARRLYPEDGVQSHVDVEDGVQVLFEYDFLQTRHQEIYFVICLFGVEFAINLGGAEIEGYEAWLNENQFASTLYTGKNASFDFPTARGPVQDGRRSKT